MKIGVDYHLVSRNTNSGMGVYVSQIVKAMRSLNKKNEIVIYKGTFLYKKKLVNIFEKILNVFKEMFWIQIVIPINAFKEKIDILYFPNPPIPFFIRKPSILTIPDLSFYYDKSTIFLLKYYLLFIYFFSAHLSKVITTFSVNSKRDIVKILGVNPNKIKIVTPAISENIKINTISKLVLKRYRISSPYILSVVGTFVPRKNAADLIQMFKILPKNIQKNLQVVIVGNNNDDYFSNFQKLVKKTDLANKIICTGYVSERDLISLYSNAKLFVSTSLYEGFGLPPLEAMACEIPVIVYKNSSMAEVVGNGGVTVDGVLQLSEKVEDLLSNTKLRKKLIKFGLSRAKNYSWYKSGRNILNIFEENK